MSSSQIDQPKVSIGGSGFQFKGKRRAKHNPTRVGNSRLDVPHAPGRMKFYRRLIIIGEKQFIKEILPKFDSDQKRANESNVWCVTCRKRLPSG